MRKNILAIVFLAICPMAFAQQAMNNDDIVKMVRAGQSDDQIVSSINASPGAYVTSVKALTDLQSQGVSARIIMAMMRKANGSAPAASPSQPPAAAPVQASPAPAPSLSRERMKKAAWGAEPAPAPVPPPVPTPAPVVAPAPVDANGWAAAPAPARNPVGLNNDSIIKMVKAGLSDDLIIATINAEPGTYDATADALIALKAAGASDKLVITIVVKASAHTP